MLTVPTYLGHLNFLAGGSGGSDGRKRGEEGPASLEDPDVDDSPEGEEQGQEDEPQGGIPPY